MEQVVKANGIDIWCEDFGREADPAILLIMGIGTSGVAWPDELCERLVSSGFRVVRYDNRDTGLSSYIDFSRNPYTLADMAADAVGLLDALGIPAAHVVGASMGGMVAQEMAINHPERVLSLASMISTPAIPDPSNPMGYSGGLPGMKPELLAVMMESAGQPVTTREERIEASLKLYKALAGTRQPVDDKLLRAMKERELDRLPDERSMAAITEGESSPNQAAAISASRDRVELLASVSVPTVVVHGSEDPIFPYEHGVATAKAVPGAKFISVEGMGHELPDLPELATIILENIAAA